MWIIFEDIRRSNSIYYFSELAWWQSQLWRSQSSLLIILFRQYIIRHLKLVKCLFCYAFHILFGKACLPDDFGDNFYFSLFFSPELRVLKVREFFLLVLPVCQQFTGVVFIWYWTSAGRCKQKHVFIRTTNKATIVCALLETCICRCILYINPILYMYFFLLSGVSKCPECPDFLSLWQNCSG